MKLASFTLLIAMTATCTGAYPESDSNPAKIAYALLQQQRIDQFITTEAGEGEYTWQILVASIRGGQQLTVFDSETKEAIYQYRQDDPMDAFVRLTVVELDNQPPLIATVWLRGVHGTQFILMDPLNNRTAYHLTSAWPLTYEACTDGISITVSTGTDDDGEPIFETHYWQNSNAVITHNGEKNHCDIEQ